MADNATSPTYEEVAGQVRARDFGGFGEPKPDMPVTIAPPLYGDPGHVNPAINPAPPPPDVPERIAVPVINDPGILGSSPSLADLNRNSRQIDLTLRSAGQKPPGDLVDLPDGPEITEESNREEIREAAEQRIHRLMAEQDGAAEGVRDEVRARTRAAKRSSDKGSKLGSASKP